MYTSIAPSYFMFLALSILTFIHSVTSLPIQTSTWVKIDQYEDPDSLGLWKVFEKEAQTSLPNPSHANQINVSIHMEP
ncbi:uncharacterized protein N7506_006095 [Penicillium brevicompactum]|uniref:uncharacterized protein n=1 Tax=Penicillium brevicompactum TaxID=5074 RepID=UPI002540EF23|nr:uncharacterized protein N7506_006095 [Penicillium brevicompactum]KAJ5332312.1 hypothetical protein N7506_006095 [Penicillium brevicompactum]